MAAFFAVLIATFIGGVSGLIALSAMFPVVAVGFAFAFKTLWWLPLALAAPTTIIILPMIHTFVPNPFLRTAALVLGGVASGVATIYAVLDGLAGGVDSTRHQAIFCAGSIAGVAAAAAFDSIAREID